MCGFLFFYSKNRKISENHFNQALKLIEHRGPDHSDHQYFQKQNVYLGHQRLSILDLSDNANQPLSSSNNDDRYTIVYNGEIYNFKDIIQKYNLDNYQFKSKSDTEIFLFLISKFKNLNKINELNGIFSFVIFDKFENTVYFAVDRVGVKPLYYYLDDENLVICSELKPIKKLIPNLSISKEVSFIFRF